jgi:Ca2+-binding RTX toxin-like protein
MPVLFYGNGGDDTLVGGSGGSAMLGGDGDDTLGDGSGCDLLIGGGGKDLLEGGHGEDVLVGGSIADDQWADPDARLRLCPEFDVWRDGYLSYDVRATLLRGGPLAAGHIHDDAADVLRGGQGRDLFFGNAAIDSLPDRVADELPF